MIITLVFTNKFNSSILDVRTFLGETACIRKHFILCIERAADRISFLNTIVSDLNCMYRKRCPRPFSCRTLACNRRVHLPVEDRWRPSPDRWACWCPWPLPSSPSPLDSVGGTPSFSSAAHPRARTWRLFSARDVFMWISCLLPWFALMRTSRNSF